MRTFVAHSGHSVGHAIFLVWVDLNRAFAPTSLAHFLADHCGLNPEGMLVQL
jgi:hypothetical protein